jgi:anaphase-promoting complex subunit 10
MATMDEVEYGEYEGDETTQEGDCVEEEHEEDRLPHFDLHPLGLKEISNLGKFTVSTHKPENGVEELRSDDLTKFWQLVSLVRSIQVSIRLLTIMHRSDGVQPHHLTVYFVKKVAIREIRFFVDYEQDESYTPTRIVFRSGTSENNLMQFALMELDRPKGWQKVPFDHVGGGPDGHTLYSWVLQMTISDNHQNGKDTHLRGIKIFAPDNDADATGPAPSTDSTEKRPTKATRFTENLLEHGPQPYWGPPPYLNPERDSFSHDTPELRRMYPEHYEPELMWPPVSGPGHLARAGGRPTNAFLQSDDETPSAQHGATRARTTQTRTTRTSATDGTEIQSAQTEEQDARVALLLEAMDSPEVSEYLKEPELR